MLRILLFLLAAIVALGADEPWAKVRGIKRGTELRIYKTSAKLPVLAQIDEANEENLIIIVKNEQMAIARDQIDRIDYRPPGGRVSKETKSRVDSPETGALKPDGAQPSSRPSSSSSTSVSVHSKPDFETIYRRPVMPPAPK
jgi:hypothetical protein